MTAAEHKLPALPRPAPERRGALARAILLLVVATGGAVGGGGLLTYAGTQLKSAPWWALLGLPVGVAVLAVLMLSPSLAFMLTATIIPIERLGRLTSDSALVTISLMRIVGTIALGSFLLHALVERKRIVFGAAFWLYTAYLVLAFGGIGHTTHHLGTVRAIGAILGNLLFFFLVINMGREPKLAQRAVLLWLAATVVVGIYTVFAWHLGRGVSEADLGETSSRFSTVMQDTSEWEALDTVARASGPTSHSAVYAINLILTLPFFFYFRKHARSPAARVALVGAVLVVLYNVFLTNTRAAMMLAAGVVALCGMRGLYRITGPMLVGGALSVAALLPFVPDAIWNRVLDASNYSSTRSATLNIRFEYWSAGLRIIQDHWLRGVGVGNQVEVPRYLRVEGPEETTVHNEFIMTAMEVGLPGWLVFFGFVALMYWAATRGRRLATQRPLPGLHADFFVAVQIAMLATLVYGLQVDVFHFPLKGWWLIAALSWALYRTLAERAAHTTHPPPTSALTTAPGARP